MITVALGSLGISISFPTGPVICTSDPGFKSPGIYILAHFNKKKKKKTNTFKKYLVFSLRWWIWTEILLLGFLHKKFEQTPLTTSPWSLVYTTLLTHSETCIKSLTGKA